jgi:NADPH:quinone reductase-like Zn-dependent oxidoreductase
LTLGSDLSGFVEAVGPGVNQFNRGDEVYGVTNPQFVGAHAEYAVAAVDMIAPKPRRLSHLQAASVPVVAVTAWQMLFEHARLERRQSVMVLGAAGNVGAYASFHVIAVVGSKDVAFVRALGASDVIDYRVIDFAEVPPTVDAVIDTIGGETRDRATTVLKPGGILVTVVSTAFVPARADVRMAFFYAEVTTARLNTISRLLDCGTVHPHVGSVLPLAQVRAAHDMLAGAAHERGKIMLNVED